VRATSKFLSPQEVGEQLGVDVQTVRRWIHDGRLRAFKPGKEYRIREADLEEFLAAREVRPKAARRSPFEPSLFNAVGQERQEKVRLGDVASDQRLAEVKAEHDRLNEALEAGEITRQWYTARVVDLYNSLFDAAERADKETG
jgi:excisionase family DNA binding protein